MARVTESKSKQKRLTGHTKRCIQC